MVRRNFDPFKLEALIQKPPRKWCCKVHRLQDLYDLRVDVPWAALERIQAGGNPEEWTRWAETYRAMVEMQVSLIESDLAAEILGNLAAAVKEADGLHPSTRVMGEA